MKILHSSDWHIGKYLYGRKRYEEFEAFFDWLLKEIIALDIDVLLVAGDIFDTSTPNNRAQEIYYRFLCNVAQSNCKHIVVIAGNHDSPSFISAPKNILKSLNVHVVGTVPDDLADEVIELKNENDELELIVCAVPYLRDKDVRKVQAGESLEDKSENLVQGIKEHYRQVAAIAVQKREAYLKSSSKYIPIIGMGHLFAAGGSPGEGVRDLYVGSLGYVSAEAFPKEFDYVALGHLHIAQKVSGLETLRYCGSPIPMGFGEAKQVKKLISISYENNSSKALISEIPIPNFQSLEKISAGDEQILNRISDLLAAKSSSWLEIEYEGENDAQAFREKVLELISASEMELLRFKSKNTFERYLLNEDLEEKLEDLSPEDVFSRRLEMNELTEEKRKELMYCYGEILKSISEKDLMAE